MSETEIINGIIAGDKEQFSVLITRYNELLYRTGMSYLHDHTEVEDLMQTTYLKAFEHLNQYHQQSSFSTWLTRIMINECLMLKRKRRTISDNLLENERRLQDIVDSTSPETEVSYKQMKEICEQMLLKLPEEYRIIFVLREVQKLSTHEVADIVGITEDNVKIKLFRAKRKLQRLLVDHLGDADLFNYDKKYCNLLTSKVMKQVNNHTKV